MRAISLYLLVFCVFFNAGCEGPESGSAFPIDSSRSQDSVYSRFGPARIDILPITTLTPSSGGGDESAINAYVCLLDSFDSQIKAPVTFRFELFQYIQRSADPKGKRLNIWPDIDLTNAGVNNSHWQDFLRSYQFSLPLQQRTEGDACILQATCICPSGKRLWADFIIRPSR